MRIEIQENSNLVLVLHLQDQDYPLLKDFAMPGQSRQYKSYQLLNFTYIRSLLESMV